jgi:hypothetical protein
MLQVYSVQEVMKARVKDMEDMLAQCMKLEEETGIIAIFRFSGEIVDIHAVAYPDSRNGGNQPTKFAFF